MEYGKTLENKICDSCETSIKSGSRVLMENTEADRDGEYETLFYCADCAPMIISMEIEKLTKCLKYVVYGLAKER